MMRSLQVLRHWLLAAALAALAVGPAQADGPLIEVDLELALLADVSRSMSPMELEIQRRGYAAALISDEVFAAIQAGLLQTIALSYTEWAGSQKVIVDWRLIRTREDLLDFARELTVAFDPNLRRTSISNALDFAAASIENNRFAGLRRVIDISGDGPNNLGPLVTEARDRTLAKRITINGLPLMTDDGVYSMFHLDNLDIYYTTCVTGGPGSFVIPVYDWPDFQNSVQRKLVLEIAGLTPPLRPIRAQMSARDPTDCRIGEKIWQLFRDTGDFLP